MEERQGGRGRERGRERVREREAERDGSVVRAHLEDYVVQNQDEQKDQKGHRGNA